MFVLRLVSRRCWRVAVCRKVVFRSGVNRLRYQIFEPGSSSGGRLAKVSGGRTLSRADMKVVDTVNLSSTIADAAFVHKSAMFQHRSPTHSHAARQRGYAWPAETKVHG